MPLRKTAIAISAELLDEVDEVARSRGESRSSFIASVLRLALRARRDQEITRRLEVLFADDASRAEQRQAAEVLDELGTDWTDERW
jgi:metal-responsive CopG/Arc/MetJ family transcriptional regulator